MPVVIAGTQLGAFVELVTMAMCGFGSPYDTHLWLIVTKVQYMYSSIRPTV